jgi:hypothetical protein
VKAYTRCVTTYFRKGDHDGLAHKPQTIVEVGLLLVSAVEKQTAVPLGCTISSGARYVRSLLAS